VNEILLGFMVAAWLFTVGSSIYVYWRYNYAPWKVMRADVAALNAKIEEHVAWVKNELGLRKAMGLSDEETAALERRLKARTLWRNPEA